MGHSTVSKPKRRFSVRAGVTLAATLPMLTIAAGQAAASTLPPPRDLHVSGDWEHAFQARWRSVSGAHDYGVRVFHRSRLVRQFNVTGTVANVGSLRSGTVYQVFVRTNARGNPAAITVITRRPPTFGQRAASYARTLVGDAYVYGGTGPSDFDCSGLTQYVYHHLGHYLPRTAEEQYAYMHHTSRPSAGDLVFFLSGGSAYHVGVYEGRGAIVDAATPSQGVVYQQIWSSDIAYGAW
jgi:cell wall-associated NlpC family hydrolase